MTSVPHIRNCNCRVSNKCPVNNQCLISDVIYKAEVHSCTRSIDNNKLYKYVGATSTTFKNRFTNHTHSFKHDRFSNSTSLSRLIHELKDKGINYKMEWDIVKFSVPYRGGGRVCNLCVCESYEIIMDKVGILSHLRIEYCEIN